MSIVASNDGLTTLGYMPCMLAAILLFPAASFIIRDSSGKKTSAKQLIYCSVAMALTLITSYLELFDLPFDDSITLFSMLFIYLAGYRYGLKVGILIGLAYGILQFPQEPFVLSFFQVCCDYIPAFAALGLSRAFYKSRSGLLKGYILGILARGAFHVLDEYLYWMDYMPDNFPQSLTTIHPPVHNYFYILAEGILAIILAMLSPVSRALTQVKRAAMK